MNMVDVIIPTYKPDDDFIRLIYSLKKQTVQVNRIIIMNTEECYWGKMTLNSTSSVFDDTDDILEIHHISKREFDHGRTRRSGVKYSKADIFVMMTQDAVPADEFFIERIIAPLSDEKVATSYARQLPKANASITEEITRKFNYPDKSSVKSIKDIDKLGIKTYFSSNVACAYNRAIYDKLGGFIKKTIFNEDMIYAAGAVKAGYSVAYAADALVYHSHNLGGREQFHRNVDLGVSQAEHPEVFKDVPSEGEGAKLVKLTIKELAEKKKYLHIVSYIYVCACRYAGYLVGKNYKKLPSQFVKWCSMSPDYFNK